MSVTIAPNIHHDPPRPPRAVLPTIRRSLARRELPLLPGLVDLDPGREQVVRAGLEGAVDGVSGEVDAGPLPVLADVGYHQCAGNGVVIDHGSVVAGPDRVVYGFCEVVIYDECGTGPRGIGRLNRGRDGVCGAKSRLGLRALDLRQQWSPRGHAFGALGDVPSANVELSARNEEGLGSGVERSSRDARIGIGGSERHVGGAGEYNLHGGVGGRNHVGIGHLKDSLDKDIGCAEGGFVIGRDVEFASDVEAADGGGCVEWQIVLLWTRLNRMRRNV